VRLEQSFEVPATLDTSWTLLNDVPRIVPCMPGAELTEVVDENAWKAVLRVKLGPIALQFGVDLTRQEADEAARRAVLAAKARELKGRGGAQATIESTLSSNGAATRVSIVTELTLQGAVAQYGRGVVADVASQLTARFAECIAKQLDTPTLAEGDDAPPPAPPAKPIGGVRLILSSLWRSLVRLVRRG
jgi:uncharacterized protein